jgi:archaeosine synthase
VFEVLVRDGAGRIARWERQPGLGIETPGILWVRSELADAEAAWTPQLGPQAEPGVFLVNTGSIQADESFDAGGAEVLVLRRRLETPAAMQADASGLRRVGRLFVMTSAASVFRNPHRFAAALVRARQDAGYDNLLYTPGLGEPMDLAVLAYSGVDVFDSVACSHAAARGRFLAGEGSFEARGRVEPECVCPGCDGQAPADLDETSLRRHNQWAARQELGRVRNAIRTGRLRELVEMRVRAHPERVALLRRLDARHDFFEERTPVESQSPVWATTKESLGRPEVVRFQRRVRERYRPPARARVLLLLPCSARKPYGVSQSHRRFHDAVWRAGASSLTEEWIVTSPMGVVPRALERVWPVAQYDVPVTGEWDAGEGIMIRGLLSDLLARRPWDTVVAHLPAGTMDLVRPVLPADVVETVADGSPTKGANLGRLEAALREATQGVARPSLAEQLHDRLRIVADHQFGHGLAERLFEDTRAVGKWPGGKLKHGDAQLASLPINKGLLSLTLEGGRRLMDAPGFQVEIDDFEVKGGVFAVGVRSADASIRAGDEVVLHHGGDIRGVGVALMSGPEMTSLERGPAVKVRHHA